MPSSTPTESKAGWPRSTWAWRAASRLIPRSCSSSSPACGRIRCVSRVATRHPIPSATPEAGVTTVGWTWLAIAAMGVGHGINPAMGWLFAVGLGLQEGRSQAVWRALPPLALGHALAITTAALTAVAVGQVVPADLLPWIVGGSLLTLGSARLIRH